MDLSLKEYSDKIVGLKGQRDKVIFLHEKALKDLETNKQNYLCAEKAQYVIQKIANETQNNLVYRIEKVVSSALQAVYGNNVEFKIDFDIKRGGTEAHLYFLKNGKEEDPMESSGYGAVDIASLALRIVLWSLNKTKHNSIMLLDEPLKHLSGDLQEKGMMMLQEISKNMGIQFIVITHTPADDVLEYSNKVFEVKQDNNISYVEVLKG